MIKKGKEEKLTKVMQDSWKLLDDAHRAVKRYNDAMKEASKLLTPETRRFMGGSFICLAMYHPQGYLIKILPRRGLGKL